MNEQDQPTVHDFLMAMKTAPKNEVARVLYDLSSADCGDENAWGDMSGDWESQAKIIEVLRGYLRAK